MKTKVIVAVVGCVLAVVMAPCSLAQLRIMDGIIVSDNNPNTPPANLNVAAGDLCVANPCAQEFSVPQILAGGQTMRVNLYAAGPDHCVAQVGFNDMNGNVLVPSTPVNQAPGTGTSVYLNADALQLKLGQRIEALPVITVTAPVGAVPLNSVCNISSEVYDHLTGRTMTHQGMLAGLPAVQSPAQTPN